MESLYSPFFKKFQRELLAIANSDYGRALFQIPEKEKIVKLSPNSYHIELDKGLYKATFRGYDLYSSIVTGGLPTKKIPSADEMLPFIARKSHSMAPYFYLPLAANLTFYTGAGDGHVYYIQGGESSCPSGWDAILDQANGNNIDYTSDHCFAMITQNGGGSTVVARAWWPFNTASLGAGVIIQSGIFSLFGYANYSDTDGKSVSLVEGTQASTSQLVASDYSQLIRTVLLSDTSILLHLSNVAYNNWPLNATGLTKISKTGFTKFATLGNVDQTDSCTSGPVCGHSVWTSEGAGTSTDPKLAVTYTYHQGGFF